MTDDTPGAGAAAVDPARFSSPPREFRPAPFWGINDRLTDTELRRQVQAMRDGGWAGFFVHPRYGMETPYLSREYLDRMRTIRDEASAQQLDMWLYDEHPFPAGGAGGLVAAGRPELRHRVLAVNLHNRLTPTSEAVAYFAATIDNPPSFTRISDPHRDSGEGRWFAHFYEWSMPTAPTAHRVGDNGFIHGFPYPDLLNPDAAQKFIEVTYASYAQAIGDSFGSIVKGSFSDMPLYHWHYASPHPSVPWSPRLPAEFKDRYGYDLIDMLPALFYPVPDHEIVRHDFWQLASDLFVNTFTAPLAAWCRSRKLIYTAHYWGEETLPWQVAWTGDVMHHFAHQDYVGCDHILRNIEDPIGIKQASTVAEQLGKPRTVAETYALSGHNLTYAERKWIGEWEYALGVNFLVPYVPSYSMRGRRKRDEPPSQFLQQPYWIHEPRLSVYFARLGYLLTRGDRVVDILLLQPLSTAYSLYTPSHQMPPAWHPHDEGPFEGGGSRLHDYSEAFRVLAAELLAAHRDFHIGNEQILAEHGRVSGANLTVGRGSYRIVIVPPSLTWHAATITLLEKFAADGGVVIACEPAPSRIDGRPAERVLPAEVLTAATPEAVLPLLAANMPSDVELANAPEVICQHRVSGDHDIFFFANTSRTNAYPGRTVQLRVSSPDGELQRWDPLTGQRAILATEADEDGHVRATLDFAPLGSHLLVRTPAAANPPLQVHQRELADPSPLVSLDRPWAISAHDPNAITLDYCTIQVGSQPWTGQLPVWRAHEYLRHAGVGSQFRLRFRALIRDMPDSIALVLERPDRYRIVVNGSPVATDSSRQWWDPSLFMHDISSAARTGDNIIELAGVSYMDTELESVYLVGDFTVEGHRPFGLCAPVQEVEGRNLVDEGFPFYPGRVTLRQSFEWNGRPSDPAWLRFETIDAVASQASVNGNVAAFLAWPPYQAEISRLLRPGLNSLEVELATSLHNLLGPHHDRRGEARHFVLDRSWMDAVNWTDDYFFVPFGLSAAQICHLAS